MTTTAINNSISLDIPDADMQIIQAAVKALQDTLVPHLVDVGTSDRTRLSMMGAKSVDFVAKTLSYTLANKELVQTYVDVDEFQRDFAAVSTLRDLLQPLALITHKVESSMMLSGCEAYAAALSCYDLFKAGKKRNVPGAEFMAVDLATQFTRPSPKKAAASKPIDPAPAIKGSVAPMASATAH